MRRGRRPSQPGDEAEYTPEFDRKAKVRLFVKLRARGTPEKDCTRMTGVDPKEANELIQKHGVDRILNLDF